MSVDTYVGKTVGGREEKEGRRDGEGEREREGEYTARMKSEMYRNARR